MMGAPNRILPVFSSVLPGIVLVLRAVISRALV
jgi:hypothetical protein